MQTFRQPKMHDVRDALRKLVVPFAKHIHPAYVALNHTWRDTGTPYIPTVTDIENLAYTLITRLTEDSPTPGIQSDEETAGGIYVSWNTCYDNSAGVKLEYRCGSSASVINS